MVLRRGAGMVPRAGTHLWVSCYQAWAMGPGYLLPRQYYVHTGTNLRDQNGNRSSPVQFVPQPCFFLQMILSSGLATSTVAVVAAYASLVLMRGCLVPGDQQGGCRGDGASGYAHEGYQPTSTCYATPGNDAAYGDTIPANGQYLSRSLSCNSTVLVVSASICQYCHVVSAFQYSATSTIMRVSALQHQYCHRHTCIRTPVLTQGNGPTSFKGANFEVVQVCVTYKPRRSLILDSSANTDEESVLNPRRYASTNVGEYAGTYVGNMVVLLWGNVLVQLDTAFSDMYDKAVELWVDVITGYNAAICYARAMPCSVLPTHAAGTVYAHELRDVRYFLRTRYAPVPTWARCWYQRYATRRRSGWTGSET
eukprot:596360-Rhodomonas_salina.6